MYDRILDDGSMTGGMVNRRHDRQVLSDSCRNFFGNGRPDSLKLFMWCEVYLGEYIHLTLQTLSESKESRVPTYVVVMSQRTRESGSFLLPASSPGLLSEGTGIY